MQLVVYYVMSVLVELVFLQSSVKTCWHLQNDYDMVEYLNDLRESCLEAYTGIVQGLKGESVQISGTYSCYCYYMIYATCSLVY